MKNYACLDLETTGVDVGQSRIVEIAIVYDDLETGELKRYVRKVNPEIPIPKEAAEVHGIKDEDVVDSPKLQDIADEFLKILGKRTLITYNGKRFDIPLLVTQLQRIRVNWFPDQPLVDGLELERKLNPNTLSAVYERYVGEELEDAHQAEADVLATLEILEKQIETRELPNDLLELSNYITEGTDSLDLMGKLIKIEDKVCWNFGKYKGQSVLKDYSYFNWYLKQPMLPDTRKILTDQINGR